MINQGFDEPAVTSFLVEHSAEETAHPAGPLLWLADPTTDH